MWLRIVFIILMFPTLCLGEGEMGWIFDQARNVATVTTKQVMHENLPILSVVHYSDDDSWAFTCGTTNEASDLMLVSMGEIVDTDSTLYTIANLPPGWSAHRQSVKHEWIRSEG